MKAQKAIALLPICLCISMFLRAQDNSTVTTRALLFADSVNNAFNGSRWNEYVAMTYPGVINYYGGTRDFREFSERTKTNLSTNQSGTLRMKQLIHEGHEWQSVVEKSIETVVEGNKAVVVSYMVGQSKDDGNTWTYFDVSYNSPSNLNYIMPDIFASLQVPQRRIVF